MKKCNKDGCNTKISENSPNYCPEHNSENTMKNNEWENAERIVIWFADTVDRDSMKRAALRKMLYKLLSSQKAEIIEMVRGLLPDIGIMAAMSMSREAVEYVNGYEKAKSDLIIKLEGKVE